MVGLRTSLSLLRKAGFSFLTRDDEAYGDSLVLGAGEASLLELARAYTTLANLGLDRPLTLLTPDSDVSGTNPISAAADLPSGLAKRDELAARPPSTDFNKSMVFPCDGCRAHSIATEAGATAAEATSSSGSSHDAEYASR